MSYLNIYSHIPCEYVTSCVTGTSPIQTTVHLLYKPEDHWSCIAHLIAEDMLKSAVIEEKTFKHGPWAGADNPLGPKF